MRKVYASFLAGLACLTTLNATAYKVTVEVDNPDAVTVSYNSSPVALNNGVAEIEYTDYGGVTLQSAESYVLAGLEKMTPTSTAWETDYLNSATSHYINLSTEYTDGYKYKVSTGKLDDLRTATVTLKVDEPSAIRFMRSWTGEQFIPTENETEIKYVPGKETPFSIATMTGKNLYKLTVGEQEITGYSGQYSIYDVKDGDVIDVKVNYPDIKQALVFNLSEGCQEGFITSVTVDNAPLENWQNAQVQVGSSVSVAYNTSDFKITKFDMNGTSISSYGNYYSPYTFVMNGDVTFDIEAAPYAVVPMTVNVSDASHVILYKGYDSTNPDNVFSLQNGTNTINVSETEGTIHLKASPLANILSVTQDGNPLSKDYSEIYNIEVKNGSTIDIETELIRRDDTLIFYFDSPAKASDQSNGLYGYNFSSSASRISYNLNEGYNEVKFGSIDGDMQFSVYNGTVNNVFFYVNGVMPTYNNDYVNHSFTPANGDVLKCFVGERPSEYSLTFEVAEDAQVPEVTLDKITELETLEPQTVLQATSVSIRPAADSSIKVTVGDNAIEPADGVYEFAVNSDTAVKISNGSSSVGSITDCEGKKIVHNMQGMRVDADNLPAGIYVINGKKVILK